jgi:ribosomal protein L12E/L44/L45/RPP1/RPP2
MCYNCGCGVPSDDMGKGHLSKGGGSLTEDDLKVVAEKWGMSVEDVKKNILDILKKEVGEK